MEQTEQTLKSIVETCTQVLAARKLTIAFTESATAGKLSYCFSQTELSGRVLKGGLVCYDACIKEDVLGVPKDLIDQYTPESAEVTREMALRMRNLVDAEIIVATTGLPKPGGSESAEKPVGTMFFCILFKEHVFELREIFIGAPEDVINASVVHVAGTILEILDQLRHDA